MTTQFLVKANNVGNTLNGAINDSVTTITLADASGFPSTYPYHVTIDSEIVRVTNKGGNNLTVVRGQEGTAAAAHSNAADCELLVTAKHLQDLDSAVGALEDGHDHTSAGGQGGVLTADEHDSFSEYAEVATPGNPANNKVRVFSRSKSGEPGYSEYVLRGPAGDECVICTLPNTLHVNKLILNHIE